MTGRNRLRRRWLTRIVSGHNGGAESATGHRRGDGRGRGGDGRDRGRWSQVVGVEGGHNSSLKTVQGHVSAVAALRDEAAAPEDMRRLLGFC